MIRDISTLDDGAELRDHTVIIGAGLAGIDLARTLANRGTGVTLVESGRIGFDHAIQELARFTSVGRPLRAPDPEGPFTPYLDPIFRGECRVRQFGGTSNIWTGKWRRFEPLDFRRREWVPGSGWPIGRNDLDPYYRDVMKDYGLGDFDGFAADAPAQAAADVLSRAGLQLSFHYWAEETARPAHRFRDELERSEHVDVVLGANAVELVLDETCGRVQAVECRALEGRRLRVIADRFVLCTGGMEVARLLLASDRQLPNGIGNDRGLVGRFYMDHLKTKHVRLEHGPALDLIEPWTRTIPRPCFHVSVSLAERTQAELRVLDHAVYMRPVYRYLVDYPHETADRLRGALRERRPLPALQAALSLLRSPAAVRKVLERTVHRDRSGPVSYYDATLYLEQAPNRESRLSLSAERDALGMRKLLVDWRLNELDHASFERLRPELVRRFAHAGLGRLHLDEPPLSLDDMIDAAHHIGSARMADSPDAGVVDANCRVYGTDNLYVASSAVFPTGHSAAPTMTILALCRRLARHLASAV